MWDSAAIAFELDDAGTDWPFVTVRILTPVGDLWIMAEVQQHARTLFLDGLNIHGASADGVGISNLRSLAIAVMEFMDADTVIVQGTARTTGANPGRIPGTLRFTRYTAT